MTVVVIAVFYYSVIELIHAKDKTKIECFVEYLKIEHRVQDESFSSIDVFFSNYKNCEKLVEENLNKFLNQTKLKLIEKLGQENFFNCVIKRLRSHKSYIEMIILAQILDHIKVSKMIWKYFARDSHLHELVENMRKIEENVQKEESDYRLTFSGDDKISKEVLDTMYEYERDEDEQECLVDKNHEEIVKVEGSDDNNEFLEFL